MLNGPRRWRLLSTSSTVTDVFSEAGTTQSEAAGTQIGHASDERTGRRRNLAKILTKHHLNANELCSISYNAHSLSLKTTQTICENTDDLRARFTVIGNQIEPKHK